MARKSKNWTAPRLSNPSENSNTGGALNGRRGSGASPRKRRPDSVRNQMRSKARAEAEARMNTTKGTPQMRGMRKRPVPMPKRPNTRPGGGSV